MIRPLFAAFALGLSPALAQDLRFDLSDTEHCLSTTGPSGAVTDCIGASAGICMEQPGGDSTYGMGFCLDNELQYWDGLLNESYQNLRAAMQVSDTDLPDTLAVQAPSLRDMQRAWISYRDARCSFEASLWQGGTGASPAFLSCLLQMTGEQALYLMTTYSGEG